MRAINKNENRSSFFYIILLIIIVILIQTMVLKGNIERLTYAEFKELSQQKHRILKCTISANNIRGTYIKDEAVYKEFLEKIKTNPEQKEKISWKDILLEEKYEGMSAFSVTRVFDDPKLVEMLHENNVDFDGEMESHWGALFFYWIFPLLLLVIFFVILMRRMNNYGRDVMSFGKSRAKISAEEDTKTGFSEVAGCDEAKEELGEIVDFLKSPKKFEELGGKIPKGALLVGPPGTGKTLLSRAVAGEAGVPFFNISGSEFVEMFVGVGASRVRDLFAQAKAKSPCIVFIDEIDAVGRHRGAGLGGGHDEREQTLNQLLAEMDGFESNKGIIVLAATNRPDILDPALLRPGRFDRQIVIDQPDIKGREQILQIHAKGKPLAEEVDLKVLAKRTPGFSGADLANVMNEAALLAARKNKREIEQVDIAEAVERVIAGPERKSRIISDKEKENTAYHECGHALIAALHKDVHSVVHKITIIPRGRALGYVLHVPKEDKFNISREELLAQVCIGLAGRIAEEVALNIMTVGASDDLQKVTNIVRSLVAKYGMSDVMGPLAYEKEEGYVFLGKNQYERQSYFSEDTLNQIDAEVKKIVLECYEKTKKIIVDNRHILDTTSQILLKREHLEGKEFLSIVDKLKKGENVDEHFEVPAEKSTSTPDVSKKEDVKKKDAKKEDVKKKDTKKEDVKKEEAKKEALPTDEKQEKSENNEKNEE